MNARHEMSGILGQWLQLTQDEGVAIHSKDWPAVIRIQARKAVLRDSFTVAAKKCAEEGAADGLGKSTSRQFRLEVAKIVSLLTRNSEALALQLRETKAHQELLEQSRQNLRRIQRSYLRSQPSKALHSYS